MLLTARCLKAISQSFSVEWQWQEQRPSGNWSFPLVVNSSSSSEHADPGGDIFDKDVSNLTLTLQQLFQDDITENNQGTAVEPEAEAFEEREEDDGPREEENGQRKEDDEPKKEDDRPRKKDEHGPSDTEMVGKEVEPREQDKEEKDKLSDITMVGSDDVTAGQDIQEGLSPGPTYNFAVVIKRGEQEQGPTKKTSIAAKIRTWLMQQACTQSCSLADRKNSY